MELTDAATRLAELASGDETVILTRDGVPVARLVPVRTERDQARIDAAVDALKTFGKGRRLDGLTIKELIDEGRL